MSRLASLAALLTGFFVAHSLLQAGSKDKALVRWQPDIKSAHKIALAENKPILLVFGAEWCTYCHKLERETINTPGMAAYINENFVPVHLDADKEQRVTELLDVKSLPCTVVISPKAELLGKFTGYCDAAHYEEKLVKSQEVFRSVKTASLKAAE